MRSFLTTTLFLSLAMPSRGETFVYVSMAQEQKVQVFRLDSDDGKLTPVETVALEGAPGSLAIDPDKKYLFASVRGNSTLASFRIDPTTGKLKPLSTGFLQQTFGFGAGLFDVGPVARQLLQLFLSRGKRRARKDDAADRVHGGYLGERRRAFPLIER